MDKTQSSVFFAVSLVSLLVTAGCGGSNLPDTSPVTGTVLYKGEPVEDATVLFSRGSRNMSEGEVAIGKTDAEGNFVLSTHVGSQTDVKGAVPGTYEVTFSKGVPPPGISETEYYAKLEAANEISATGRMVPPDQQPPPLVELFPKQYSASRQSELSAEVVNEPNHFEFDLK